MKKATYATATRDLDNPVEKKMLVKQQAAEAQNMLSKAIKFAFLNI